MQVLNEKYQEAIEAKYSGSTHKDIATHLELPKGTVDDWFRTRGVLSPYYKEFAEEMEQKRKTKIETSLYVKDIEFHFVMRKILVKMNESLEKNNFVFRVTDFFKIWRMQRIMQGKPIGIYSRVCPCCKKQTTYSRFGK